MRPEATMSAGWASAAQRWWAPLAVGLAASAAFLFVSILIVRAQASAGWGYDFAAYYNAAVRLLETGSPYQVQTLEGPFRPGPGGLYLYSPVPALLLVPITALEFGKATVLWLVLRIGLLALTCAVLPVAPRIRLGMLIVAALSAPVLYDMNLGNVSLIVTFFAAVSWRFLDRPLGSFAVAASLFMRPPMALFGAWWLLRRQWRAFAWLLIGAFAILAFSVPFVGIERWLEYATVLGNVSHVTGVPRNLDLSSTALSLGVPLAFTPWFLFGGYVLAIGAMLLSLRRDRDVGFSVTLMATLLLSPLLWDHYLTNLIVPGALLAARGRRVGILLPLLGWLPLAVLPLVTIAGMLLPFAVRDAPARAAAQKENESDLIRERNANPNLSGAAGA